MEFRTSIVILVLAVVALPAELMLYLVVVKKASRVLWASMRVALNFVLLMYVTAAIGVLAPLSVPIQVIIKRALT